MIVVYGGAFNPPTIAHLEICKQVIKQINPHKLLFMPVGDKYIKNNLVSSFHRMNMLKIAVKKLSSNKIIVSEIEKNQKQFLGTIHTLNEVSKIYVGHEVAFIIGADNLLDIDKWINVEELLSKYKIIVLKRLNIDIESVISENKILSKYEKSFIILDCFDELDVSSTDFREKRNKTKIVINDIQNYIKQNKLYI